MRALGILIVGLILDLHDNVLNDKKLVPILFMK